MAKVAKVRISKEVLEEVLRADFMAQPNTTVTTNAPKDLEILGLGKVEGLLYPHTFIIYVKSETFDDIPEGSEPPEIEPFVYTVHYGE